MLNSAASTITCFFGEYANNSTFDAQKKLIEKHHESADSFVKSEFYTGIIKPTLGILDKVEGTFAAVATGNTAYVSTYVNANLVPYLNKLQTAVDYTTGLLNNPAGFLVSKFQDGYKEIQDEYKLPQLSIQIPTSVTGVLTLISGYGFNIPGGTNPQIDPDPTGLTDPGIQDTLTQTAADVRDRLSKFFSAHTTSVMSPVMEVVDPIKNLVPQDIINDLVSLGTSVFQNMVDKLTIVTNIVNNPTNIVNYMDTSLDKGLKVLYENDLASPDSSVAAAAKQLKEQIEKYKQCNATNLISIFI